MASEAFNVHWKNHTASLHNQLYLRYLYQELVDVTIACMDGRLRVHRLILSSCSRYFKTVFDDNPCEHPVVIVKGASCRTFQSLVLFMYTGSVKVLREDFDEFMSLADDLKVRGLCNDLPADENTPINIHNQDTTQLELSGGEGIGHDTSNSLNAANSTTENYEQKSFEYENDLTHSKSFSRTSESEPLANDAVVKERRKAKKKNEKKLSLDKKKYFNEAGPPNIRQKLDDETSQVEGKDLLVNSTPSTSSTEPYKTRFRGKKRVNVGERLFDSDGTLPQNILKIVKVKEELQDDPGISSASDLFCISNLDTSTCEKCLKTFDSSAELIAHEASHSRKKVFQCKVCQHSFSRGSHLQRHERMHTGERPFPCPTCNYRFSRQDKLKHHYRRLHMHPNRLWTGQSRRGRKSRGYLHQHFLDSNESSVLEERNPLEGFIIPDSHVDEDEPCLEENLLDSLRQLGECTIQTISG